ncbi:hypothetical protein FHT28_004959 [Rhizobium sp. SG570]|nr:hypothetical protein [Rhizobium sp. SG741]NKJ38211.1 hypothetical protein [Rhizobium sp. SG570]
MRRSCVSDLGWIYTLFFVLLGSSAAIWGGPQRQGSWF